MFLSLTMKKLMKLSSSPFPCSFLQLKTSTKKGELSESRITNISREVISYYFWLLSRFFCSTNSIIRSRMGKCNFCSTKLLENSVLRTGNEYILSTLDSSKKKQLTFSGCSLIFCFRLEKQESISSIKYMIMLFPCSKRQSPKSWVCSCERRSGNKISLRKLIQKLILIVFKMSGFLILKTFTSLFSKNSPRKRLNSLFLPYKNFKHSKKIRQFCSLTNSKIISGLVLIFTSSCKI